MEISTSTKIICGDCRDVLSSFDMESIDLVVTSPPYDNQRQYKGYSFDFTSIACELGRVLKQGGVIVWVVNDQTKNGCESLTSFKQAIYFVEQVGLNLHDTMIWHKHSLPLTHNRYEQHFEYMFIFSKGKPKTFNGIKEPCKYADDKKYMYGHSASYNEVNAINYGKQGKRFNVKETKLKGNVWYIPIGWMHSSKDKLAFQHPAIFPEALARDHILSWSNKGDLILDPFCGSGTTGVEAKRLERNFLGIDISDEYCRIAEERMGQAHPPLQRELL